MYGMNIIAMLVSVIIVVNCEIKQVHVIFRHGDRTNDPNGLYPKDPYLNETYYPYGIGQLTNAGKQREYRIGTSLRKRYGKLLGDLYIPDVLDAVSTDTIRTKMSLQLVLAGLYNPVGTALEWNPEIHWQPIPYSYGPKADDRILGVSIVNCPNYKKEYDAYLQSPRGLKSQSNFSDLFEYLTEYTGKMITSTVDVFLMYFGLNTEKEWGLDLPTWTVPVYPSLMNKVVTTQYQLFSATPILKRLSGGFFLNKTLGDMFAKINGNLDPPSRKLFLYSAHEMNIAYILNAMEVYVPHVPPYGAYISLELHEIEGKYGIKILYEQYTGPELQILTVPGCHHICPINKFVKILEENISNNDRCD